MNEAAVRMERPLRIITECTQTKSDKNIMTGLSREMFESLMLPDLFDFIHRAPAG